MAYLIGKILGKYEIVKKIGRGGMASVFQAVDVTNERVVAIKVISPGLAEEEGFMARFRREAKVLMGLRHPNIMPILDFGEQDDLAYIVMPYMKVGTLRERLLERPLSPEEGAIIINQIAIALQYAHDAGVVHRDVKPSNIMIDEKGNAWLSDFGTAQVSEATMTLTGSGLIGTPTYMAPEQARGEKVTHYADQYALGVILYQVCTGRLPYEADTPLAIALMHAHEPLPQPRLVNANLPAKVEQVIVKAMAKEPKERYASIAKMNDAFQKTMQEVYDPESGRLKPGAKSPPPTADDFIVPSDDDDDGGILAKIGRRVPMPAMLLFLILLLGGGLWAASRIVENISAEEDPGDVAAIPTSDAQATIDALSTAVAIRSGLDDLTGEQIETAVAGTMQALETDAFGSVNETLAAAGENTLTPVPTDTPVPATETPTRTPTLTPTSIYSPTITLTRTITRTPTITLTRTITPTPTLTTTLTPPPTATPTITPTVTLTRTPTIDPCADLSLSSPNVNQLDYYVRWTIGTGGSTVTLNRWELTWSGPVLYKVELGSAIIWFAPSSPPSESDYPNREISTSTQIRFYFEDTPESGGYNLELDFSNGCTLTD